MASGRPKHSQHQICDQFMGHSRWAASGVGADIRENESLTKRFETAALHAKFDDVEIVDEIAADHN